MAAMNMVRIVSLTRLHPELMLNVAGCLMQWYGSHCNMSCDQRCPECDRVTGECARCIGNYLPPECTRQCFYFLLTSICTPCCRSTASSGTYSLSTEADSVKGLGVGDTRAKEGLV